MRMLASQAGKRAGDLANCVIETFRMPPYLARLRVEDRCNGTKQTLVLWCPEIDGKRSLIATEEQGRGYDRADSAPIACRPLPDNESIGCNHGSGVPSASRYAQ